MEVTAFIIELSAEVVKGILRKRGKGEILYRKVIIIRRGNLDKSSVRCYTDNSIKRSL